MSRKDRNTTCTAIKKENNDDDDDEMDSADEALCAMLGIKSVVKGIREEEEASEQKEDDETTAAGQETVPNYSETTRPTLNHLLSLTDTALQDLVTLDLRDIYQRDSVVYFPQALSVQASLMRRITEEVVWRSAEFASDKTYETVRVVIPKQKGATATCPLPDEKQPQQQHESSQHNGSKHNEQCPAKEDKQEECCNDDDDDADNIVVVYEERKCLTRLENFCRHHTEWNQLCTYIGRVLSIVCDTEMVLYKEKLNLKPPGGSGFAPHLDTPSLLVAARQQQQQSDAKIDDVIETSNGPTSFVTVMVAIDDMTDKNGCLRVVKGVWTADNAVETILPDQNGNPDANGRAGAIPQSVADSLLFESLPAKGGTIVAFGGYVPHRSSANTSAFGRRAVFLTYNPRSQGDFHELYYQRMQNIRNQWRRNMGLPTEDEQLEMQALSTIPRT
jgi:ectoine hydroxylase-related dioxygenase (phytanoyl-CoA dioxygenase family)